MGSWGRCGGLLNSCIYDDVGRGTDGGEWRREKARRGKEDERGRSRMRRTSKRSAKRDWVRWMYVWEESLDWMLCQWGQRLWGLLHGVQVFGKDLPFCRRID